MHRLRSIIDVSYPFVTKWTRFDAQVYTHASGTCKGTVMCPSGARGRVVQYFTPPREMFRSFSRLPQPPHHRSPPKWVPLPRLLELVPLGVVQVARIQRGFRRKSRNSPVRGSSTRSRPSTALRWLPRPASGSRRRPRGGRTPRPTKLCWEAAALVFSLPWFRSALRFRRQTVWLRSPVGQSRP